MKFIRAVLLLPFALVLAKFAPAQSTAWPQTLLWRISGHGLSKPSYLYGTMHLQDRRLFMFTDSLYASIEKTEGLALETDVSEFVDSMFHQLVREKENEIIAQEKEMKIDRKRLGKEADTLLRKFGIYNDRITKKQLRQIRDYGLEQVESTDKMATFVDAYLYGMALRQGKWVGGIEDYRDQMGALDEIGRNLNAADVFKPETHLKEGLETMIKSYVAQDLSQIDAMSGGYEPGYRDTVLIRRNVKMARRMDSLTKQRTMFFAVGAAHLPGDSGVISLLRKRGFQVDPVFSEHRIAADVYSRKLDAIPWKRYHGDDSLYSAEMPGEPFQLNLFGDMVSMKVYLDLTTMTVYMTGSAASSFKDVNAAAAGLKDMATKVGGPSGKLVSQRQVHLQDVSGVEGIIEGLTGSFKVQLLLRNNMVYMIMAGSQNKGAMSSVDVNRFFASLTFGKPIVHATRFVDFSLPAKGFSIKIPGNPNRNAQIENSATGNWHFIAYDYLDRTKGLYYMVEIRDLKAGYYVPSDTGYISYVADGFTQRMARKLMESRSTVAGFPGIDFHFLTKDSVLCKTRTVVRGNRAYLLGVFGVNSADFSDADLFFNSFSISSYDNTTWTERSCQSGHFSAPAPGSFEKAEDEDSIKAKVTEQHYYTFDSTRIQTFDIYKKVLPGYFWAGSDSAFFVSELGKHRKEEDSVIYEHRVLNGRCQGIEGLYQLNKSGVRKQVRLLLSGDTLYTLVTYIAPAGYAANQWQPFFDGFRVDDETAPGIFADRADKLPSILLTADSAELANVALAIPSLPFTVSDLPYLHRAMLTAYGDLNDYSGTNQAIVNKLSELGNPATLNFIETHYPSLKGKEAPLKFLFLDVLAKMHTDSSYRLLKKLMLADFPVEGSPDMLARDVADSQALCRSLFPDVLALCKDSLFRDGFASLLNSMLDSSVITKADILPYQRQFYQQIRSDLASVKAGRSEIWQHGAWIPFLVHFNDRQSNLLLQAFLASNGVYQKEHAAIALLKHRQPVSAAALLSIAKDRAERLSFYRDLKAMGKEALFPSQYANQKSLAESEIYLIASDDQEPERINYIGERTMRFDGVNSRFYLFKVRYSGDDAASTYLGITGPYRIGSNKIIVDPAASGLITDEAYSDANIDRMIRTYLKKMQGNR